MYGVGTALKQKGVLVCSFSILTISMENGRNAMYDFLELKAMEFVWDCAACLSSADTGAACTQSGMMVKNGA